MSYYIYWRNLYLWEFKYPVYVLFVIEYIFSPFYLLMLAIYINIFFVFPLINKKPLLTLISSFTIYVQLNRKYSNKILIFNVHTIKYIKGWEDERKININPEYVSERIWKMYRNKAIKKGYVKPNLNLDIMPRSKSVT